MAKSEFPSNSRHTPEEKPEKDVKAVVSEGGAKTRKKPLGRKFRDAFKGDDAQSVGQHILMEVLIPAAKDAITDAVIQGVQRMVYGETGRRYNGGSRGSSNYKSYSTISRISSPGRAFDSEGSRTISQRARATHDFDEVVLEDRGEAERVLDELQNLVESFDFASVKDFYTLVNVTGSYTDDKFGWTDLRGTRVERVRGGYILNLPPTIPAN